MKLRLFRRPLFICVAGCGDLKIMKVKCPYCGFEQDYKFLGFPWKGLKTVCKNCKKWFEYHIEKGYIETIPKEVV